MEQNVKNKKHISVSTEKRKRKPYDVFISYRRLSSQANPEEYKHTTSMARALALELEAEGCRVFVDVRENTKDTNDCFKKLEQSDYAIVLLADYSFEEGGGKTFRKELIHILDNMKENSCWVNLDRRFKKEVPENGFERREEVNDKTLLEMNTNRKRLIDDIPLDEINKSRLSHKTAKSLCVIFALLLIMAIGGLGVLGYKIMQEDSNKIMQEDVIFFGGGTVSNHLKEKKLNGRDITSCIPNSKYIHMPSEDAAAVLLDLRNDSGTVSYTPIILSTGEMSLKDNAAKTDFLADKRIFSLQVGSTPLRVQVRDYSGKYKDNDIIPADTLLAWLKNNNNYIFKTSDNSGTFTCYKKYIKQKDPKFDFQNVMHLFGFNPTMADNSLTSKPVKGRIKVILGNDDYFFEDKNLLNFRVAMDGHDDSVWSVPLYIYAASEDKGKTNNTKYPMSRVVFNVLHTIDTNVKYDRTGYPLTYNDDIFIKLP